MQVGTVAQIGGYAHGQVGEVYSLETILKRIPGLKDSVTI